MHVVSVKIGDHYYHGLCDIGVCVSAIHFTLYQEIVQPLPGKRPYHYCRMVLTRHYNQRPFSETVCDALTTNGGVRKPSKMRQTICDGGDIKHDSD